VKNANNWDSTCAVYLVQLTCFIARCSQRRQQGVCSFKAMSVPHLTTNRPFKRFCICAKAYGLFCVLSGGSETPFPVCRHVKGIVLVALADGTLAIFHRGVGEWLGIYNTYPKFLLCIFKQIGFYVLKKWYLRGQRIKV
jgi:hypothetical protein